MKNPFKAGDVFWMVLLLIAMAARVVYNLNHPEIPLSWMDDPRFVIPYTIVISVPVIWFWVRMSRNSGWVDRRCRRGNDVLDVVQRLNESGRKQEAGEAYQLYLRALTSRTEAEEIKRVKQILDRFGL